MSLIKDLSKVFLPKLNSINIYSVPSDSEEVRSFISKSFTSLSRFNFNNNCKKWIDASKYLEALKMAANKDVEHFGVFKTRFTAKEFCELISSAKNVRYLYIEYCTIHLDDVVDFGQIERSKIHFIYFYYTGDENYSNWKAFPLRYENLIAGISKSEGLKRSLKKLDIRYCDIPKENAQAILDKYKLNEIKIIA